ncbi:MAG: hypothetical protein M3Z02_12090 [Actinomycetota bacterium]|nr:hypothetical protein [Actinomycetota bacterium]
MSPSSLPAPGAAFDAEAVAQRAVSQDPGLPFETAMALALGCLRHLSGVGELDAPELARRCLADDPRSDASAAAVVAKAAVDHVRSSGAR